MRTVPLSGKKAAGRVALVDDEDYDLVMQYRWHIHDPEPKPGQQRKGPYAVTNGYAGGRRHYQRMHCLIMGRKGIDHKDHDGLNNQRSNLRPATGSQNNQNARPRLAGSSQYKGVCLVRRGRWWRAYIDCDGKRRWLGDFASELEAAYAYDAAARALFGEFACPNFQEGPTQAMRDQWQVAREARMAADETERARKYGRAMSEWWTQREPETFICVECGAEFQSRAMGQKLRCSKECRAKAGVRQKRKRRAEKRRRGEKVT
jgi:hypothetical protein